MALAHRRLKFPTQKPSFKLSIHRSIHLHFRLHWSRLLVRSPIGGGGSISAPPVLCSIARISPRIRSPFRDSKMVLWVFGYGSLIWNPGFEFDEKIVGFIKDYRRVFDLACIDHRGTPENPARTCTLEPMEGAICWGSAYCVRGGMEKEIAAMKYLERRECEYDTKTYLDFYREGETSEPALTGVLAFMSTMDKESNKYYLGPAPLFEMARQIATANGPFGNNRDYLFLLEKAMSDIGHEDDYIIKLANEVRKAVDSLKQKSLAKVVPLQSQSQFLPNRSLRSHRC